MAGPWMHSPTPPISGQTTRLSEASSHCLQFTTAVSPHELMWLQSLTLQNLGQAATKSDVDEQNHRLTATTTATWFHEVLWPNPVHETAF